MGENADEILARKLQAQFDREDVHRLKMEKKDLKVTRVYAKAHNISDSEDSDSADQSHDKHDGSDDLFEETDDESNDINTKGRSMKRSNISASTSRENASDKKFVLKCNTSVYDVDTDDDDNDNDGDDGGKTKPLCKYGSKCFRKNQSHLQEFFHPSKRKSEESFDSTKASSASKKPRRDDYRKGFKTSAEVFEELAPFYFFLTKVKDIPDHFNSTGAMNLKDILSNSMGTLKSSCHFNFMFDIPWLMKQYPEESRQLPLLLVHGDQGRAELDMKAKAGPYSNISLCKAKLEIVYGTHHTKMMFLLYDNGLRIVIHTANIIPNDWNQKTQGIWISPVFPRLTNPGEKGESSTFFKRDLLQYVSAYKSMKLGEWERFIKAHDFSSAKVHLIASVPGRHTLNDKHAWGHLKFKKVLMERGPEQGVVKNWPVVGQFSSIGSLGPNPDVWLLSEWGRSMSQAKKEMGITPLSSKVQLIFPTKDNIRLSLEGYNGGGCVPYSIKTASKQPWLVPFFCQWKSEGRGRSGAVPHIKTYTRSSPDGSQAAWFLVTSANLSKAAWGALEKKGSQLMIRSYELGVLFLPQDYGCKNGFNVSGELDKILDFDRRVFPLPYDLPATTYVKGDRPWFVDVPCMDAPDTFGTMWCPPL